MRACLGDEVVRSAVRFLRSIFQLMKQVVLDWKDGRICWRMLCAQF